ncbi:MAG: DUF1330 domain-containing protein [Sinimarinibacterium sp.]|jgi:uncharacterized protein (DUF1330 family)
MKYYSVAELNVTDRAWVKAYVARVTPMVERHGGRYLARTPNVEVLEGDPARPQVFLIIEWPSRDAAQAFYESEEYRPFRDARIAGSQGRFVLVAGEDINQVARM